MARRVDTARHHGVPNGCVLEVDLQAVPAETGGFDPLAMLSGGGQAAAVARSRRRDTAGGQGPAGGGFDRPRAGAGRRGGTRAGVAGRHRAFSAQKPSLAWAETYPGTLSYYLASAFREVWMQPSGTVGLVGFATNALFLRDALEKAGIEAQFVARGEYKSAANLSRRTATPTPIARPTAGWWRACTARCGRRSPSHARSSRRCRRAGRPGAAATRDAVDRAWSTGSASATRPTRGSPKWSAPKADSADDRGRRRQRRPTAALSEPLRPRHRPPALPSIPGRRPSRRSPW